MTARSRTSTGPGDTQGAADRQMSLPVLPAAGPAETPRRGRQTIRPSRNATRRAIVLGTVQLLIIAHIVLWAVGVMPRTTTPVEPSEAMEFTKHGVINAGLVFFALALLSTLILGRWFCGWGCHLVLLQDLCGWIMKKCGIRPKPFRARLLMFVPLILALYMFVWPAAYRWGVVPLMDAVQPQESGIARSERLPGWEVSTEFTTEAFWETFPGWAVAVPFLFICGFATVYFLGAKGFCTYGCPYGGFFAPLDTLAPARIRVTDACAGCGHCTAVCTSNVRVHEEVREYGMVVDPGCMKCMDCVSACPNEALYFGFGKPAVMKGEPKNQAPQRKWDLSWPEEIAIAAVFFASFMAVRGVYDGLVPMLMAAGTAGVTTYLVWKAWRLWRDANVNLHRWRMKFRGRVQRSGWIFSAVTLLVVLLTVHSGVIRGAGALADRLDARVTVPLAAVYEPGGMELNEAMRGDAERAAALYRLIGTVPDGGIGLFTHRLQPSHDLRRAWLLSTLGRFDEAEALFQRIIERHGRSETACRGVALCRWADRRPDDAIDYAGTILRDVPDEYPELLGQYVQWCSERGRLDEALATCAARISAYGEDETTLRWLALLCLETGRFDQGLAVLRRLIDLNPDSGFGHRTLGIAMMTAGRLDDAEPHLRRAVDLMPHDPMALQHLATLLHRTGRGAEAQTFEQRAAEHAPAASGPTSRSHQVR